MTIYSIRAVYNPTQNEVLMSLPCDILDAAGQEEIAQGIVLSATEEGPTTQVVVSANRPLQLGATYTLRLGLVEYHELLQVAGTVESLTSAPALFPSESQAVLTVTLGHAVLNPLPQAIVSTQRCNGICSSASDLYRATECCHT